MGSNIKSLSNNNSRLKPRKEWIIPAIMTSCTAKDYLHKLWISDATNLQLKNEYKSYSKKLDKIITDTKIKYENKMVEENCNNYNNLQKLIKSKLEKNANNGLEYLIDEKGVKIQEPAVMADSLYSYFCDIGLKLSNKIRIPNGNG